MSVFNNNLLLGAGGQGGGGFDTTLIPNSVWLDGSADFLSAELGAKTRTKAVIGTWFQKTQFSVSDATIFSLRTGGSPATEFALRMETPNTLQIFDYDGSGFQYQATTSMVLRDIGWYHIMISIDTTASAGSRLKLFINGIDRTSNLSVSPDYTASDNPSITGPSGKPTQWGVGYTGSSQFSPMYLAQSFMLDDDSIQNSDVAVSDILESFSYGTNGSQFGPKANADIATLASSAGGDSFCLDFANSSDLGNDVSSNNNDFTPTSMAAVNQSTNTPSNVYCTFNVLQPSISTMVFSEGNLRVTANAGGDGGAIGTLPMSTTGTTEFQVKTNNGDGRVGITCLENLQNVANVSDRVISGGAFSYDAGYALVEEGRKQVVLASGRTDTAGFGPSWSSGDVITVRYNADDNELNFLVNNSAVSGGTITTVAGLTYYPFIGRNDNYDITGFFDSSDFPHTIGSGNLEVNSANLTAPEFQGADFFNTVLYTGNGTAIGSGGKAVAGVGFKPDWTWIKNRDAADSHSLYDLVRGTTKQIESDNTAAETTEAESLTTFGTDGFTVGSLAQVNTNTEDYVSWNWLGSNSTSTTSPAGSTASTSTVASAGHFSVVSYTGTGSNATVGHGLGGKPDLIIIKRRSTATNWPIYSTPTTATKVFYLDLTNDASTSGAGQFQDTEPTASVFSLGTANDANGSSLTFIAYCFRSVPGVCRVGSYIGNGSTNGPYITTGFKPRWVVYKVLDSGTNAFAWTIVDTVRSPINGPNSQVLHPNLTSADSSGSGNTIDILNDGFKRRDSHNSVNQSGKTYFYMAMADIGGNGTLPPIYGR